MQKNDSILDLMQNIFTWYQEHPQWNFGGIDMIRREGDHYQITLYAGASSIGNRRFFTSKTENGRKTVDCVCRIRGSGKSSLGLLRNIKQWKVSVSGGQTVHARERQRQKILS